MKRIYYVIVGQAGEGAAVTRGHGSRGSPDQKVIPTVHFKKIVLTLSGYSDILHVAPEATLSGDYVAPVTDENVTPSDEVPL